MTKRKTVLVTGGARYIGSHAALTLVEHGYDVVVLDNLSTGAREAVPDGATFVEGDVADEALVASLVRIYGIRDVLHFAAFVDVAESVREPELYHHNNYEKTRALLAAAKAAGVERFIFSSTAAVYGNPAEIPITESCPKEPINPYGETKLAVERMCGWAAEAGKLRYAALRYFNACGAGGDGTIGEDHRPESHLIPLVIAAALGQREDIKVFGTDYPTADGTCVRDYIHIEDLCRAHLLALDKLGEERELVYNLGNGKGYSVREVIEAVRAVSGRDFKVSEVARRTGDPAVLTSDATKAKEQLGWGPKYAELEKVVETAWKWHSENPHGYEE